jgi:hypothetical protein
LEPIQHHACATGSIAISCILVIYQADPVFTPAFIVGSVLILFCVFGLRFFRQVPRSWRAAFELPALIVGLVLISPPGTINGLLHYGPFRESVRLLGMVLLVGLLAAISQGIIRAVADVSDQDGKLSQGSEMGQSTFQRQGNVHAPTPDSQTVPLRTSQGPVTLDEQHSRMIVTLVHGTNQPKWISSLGLGASKEQHDWVRPEKDFAASLLRNSPSGVQVRPFFWSGENSHDARIQAAGELQTHVRRISREYPDAEQICIGHSHGGSVIHFALGDTDFDDSLLGYAFLSTPFLDFKPRADDSSEYSLLLIAIVFTLVPTYSIAIYSGWNLFFSFRPMLLELMLITLFSIYARIYRRRVSRRREQSDEFLRAIPRPRCSPKKATFVRSPGDEASNGLGLVYLLAWMQTRSLVEVERLRKKWEAQSKERHTGLIRLIGQLIFFYAVTVWAGISSFLCSRAFSLGFGADVARHARFVQISAEPTPPGEWTVHQLLPDIGTESSLAHSSYEHPSVPVLLGDWTGALIKNKYAQALSASG